MNGVFCKIILANTSESELVMKTNYLKIFIILLLFKAVLYASDKKIEIGIDEQLGQHIPLDLTFKDEAGKDVILKDLFTKPTLLAFVYYRCPGICSPLMTSITDVINRSDLVPVKDYNIITLSMDETEKPELASDKKRNFMKLINEDFPEPAWRFLTGDSASIHKLSDAAGFYFKREGKDFIHSGTLIFINNDGKICRYLFPGYTDKGGFRILPFDFKMAIIETSKGHIIPTVASMLQYCFSYDPEGKTYVLNFTRIFGAGILVLAAAFLIFVTKKQKKDLKKR
jgi:protein SCO1/2